MKFIQLKLRNAIANVPVYVNVNNIAFIQEYPDCHVIRLISGESLEVEYSDELINLICDLNGE